MKRKVYWKKKRSRTTKCIYLLNCIIKSRCGRIDALFLSGNKNRFIKLFYSLLFFGRTPHTQKRQRNKPKKIRMIVLFQWKEINDNNNSAVEPESICKCTESLCVISGNANPNGIFISLFLVGFAIENLHFNRRRYRLNNEYIYCAPSYFVDILNSFIVNNKIMKIYSMFQSKWFISFRQYILNFILAFVSFLLFRTPR